MSYAIDDIMALDPCYDQAQVESLFAGRERLSVDDILALDISSEHKVWALTRLLPPDITRPWIDRIAPRAEDMYTLHCRMPEAWVGWARAARAAEYDRQVQDLRYVLDNVTEQQP